MKPAHKILVEAKLSSKFWSKRIIAAEGRGGFKSLLCEGQSDFVLSDNWKTCPCGRQNPWIPRDFNDAPIDRKLRKYGRIFGLAVNKHNFMLAATLLVKIEKRSAEVLAEIGA